VKAALYRNYGPPEAVVRIEEAEPPIPGEGEVLLAVRAASINPLDAHLIKGRPAIARLAFGLRRPKQIRLGVDMAGLVEAVGAGVSRFRPGDAVFGSGRGALAEYASMAESRLAAKPGSVTFVQAAAIPVAGCTALQGLRKAEVQAGQKVLVNGAAGGVGSFAVQIAKALGAEVTGICSARNLELVRAIGADRVLDYGVEDFTRGAERYDLIFDLVSNHPFSALRRGLAPGGMIVVAGGMGVGGLGAGRWALRMAGGLIAARFTRERMALLSARIDADDLAFVARLVEAGKVTPVVESCYGLDESAAAIGEVAGGHARGKVIVEMGGGT
jgi:NADPH:quinone reductase-like Zn-dependent oxidoreductase